MQSIRERFCFPCFNFGRGTTKSEEILWERDNLQWQMHDQAPVVKRWSKSAGWETLLGFHNGAAHSFFILKSRQIIVRKASPWSMEVCILFIKAGPSLPDSFLVVHGSALLPNYCLPPGEPALQVQIRNEVPKLARSEQLRVLERSWVAPVLALRDWLRSQKLSENCVFPNYCPLHFQHHEDG